MLLLYTKFVWKQYLYVDRKTLVKFIRENYHEPSKKLRISYKNFLSKMTLHNMQFSSNNTYQWTSMQLFLYNKKRYIG